MELLLAAPGLNVNLASVRGTTPLCIAAHTGREEVVRLLLNVPNIRVNARKKTGTTALFAAAQDNHANIVGLLTRHGADVNLTFGGNNTSPLAFAAGYGYTDVVRHLLQSPGVQINQITTNEATPLGIASLHGHKDIVKLLLRNGADPNIVSVIGIGPLHVACLEGHTAIVQMLLHAGADSETRVVEVSATTYTPYDLAQLVGQREIMSVLAAHRRRTRDDPARLESLSPRLRPAEPAPAKAGGQAPQEEPERIPASAGPVPATLPAGRPGKDTAATDELETEGGGETAPVDRAKAGAAAQSSPLAQARDGLIQEVLRKLEQDTLEPLEGIRILEDVRDTDSLDDMCGIYNRLAGIERQRERTRRRGRRREVMPMAPGPAPAQAGAPLFALGGREDLDADTVEDEIKGHLGQAYHRFVGQAVNDMEFGRGKRTSRYRGLWHASAGVAGVGSCSVFYYTDADARVITDSGDRSSCGAGGVPAGVCGGGIRQGGADTVHCLARISHQLMRSLRPSMGATLRAAIAVQIGYPDDLSLRPSMGATLRACTNLPGANLNSRAMRDWPRRGKVQDVLCKSAILPICHRINW